MVKRAFKYDKVLAGKFGQKIFSLRKKIDFTQDELAFKVNISPSCQARLSVG